MNTRLLKKITRERNKVEHFIDHMRAIFEKTPDTSERANRLQVFDTLLLLATYAKVEELENEFQSVLPKDENTATISYLREHLREINGFCTSTFSDEHEVYKNLFTGITPEKKQGVRDLLSKSITELIFEKTNTLSTRLSM
ncbi:hypothetical protein DGG96_20260 [Legionella qingyii]|uniref:Uncharacterized protein n=1 Tax=Legionella qingyii TaxID=2184757 RepID=A0A317TYC1_9GAMM|nr:hypothetical protein [Legionella qingyii]PWY53825.1 hypothetical protein DGG96_20260 [Legionella qingyii]RUR25535.1 hypothetical protein ELY20_03525 [Legionella qingyii]RUR28355.1 hypothetical protein ELY16_02485 [Legionella qingyii]